MTHNPNLHPIFAQMLATFSQPAVIEDAQRTAYIQALKNQDWYYEMSDDPQRYDQGRESFAQLKLARREFDKDGVIWNSIAPATHQIVEA